MAHFRDGAGHSHLRSVLHRGFNARAIAAVGEPIRRIAHELPDRAAESGTMDVAADYGFPLPAYALSEFMGVRLEDRDRVVQWAADFVDFFDVIPITEDTTHRMIRSATEMTEHIRRLLAERENEDRDDFLGLMAAAARGGELSEQEVVGSTVLVLIAGHLPVRNLIGNVIWLLLEHPTEHERLRETPSLLSSVLEESLRFEPPITAIPRIALEDVAIDDQTIRAGEIVQLSIAAANRDPSRFPDPDRFDAARNPQGVMSFGHGPHGCLGARLAKELASIALEVLFVRLGTNMRLDQAGEVRRYRNAGNRGPEALPVRFGAADER